MFLKALSLMPLYEAEDKSGAGDGDDKSQQQQQQQQQGTDGNGQPPIAPDAFLQALQTEDNRGYVKTKGFKSVDDLVNSTKELEARLGNSILLPKDPSNAEEMAPVYDRLGRPKSATPDAQGYDFSVSEERAKTLPYDKSFATKAAEKFHSLGLSKAQGKEIHDWYVNNAEEDITTSTKALLEHESKQHTEITKKWGDAGTDLYKQNCEIATRAMVELGLEDTFKRRGILGDDGTVREASIAFALLEIGKSMFSESSMESGDPTIGKNPWKKGEEWNETLQGKIFRQDKDRARTLIIEAGGNPAEYGL